MSKSGHSYHGLKNVDRNCKKYRHLLGPGLEMQNTDFDFNGSEGHTVRQKKESKLYRGE